MAGKRMEEEESGSLKMQIGMAVRDGRKRNTNKRDEGDGGW